MGPNLFREKRYDALLDEECAAAKMPSILRSKSTSGFKSVKLAEHVVVHDKGGVTTTEKMKLPPRVTVNVESLDLFKSLALKSPSFNNKRTLLGNGGRGSGDDYNDDYNGDDDDGPITTNSLRSPRSPSSTMELPSLPLPTSSSSSLSRIQSIYGNNDRRAMLSTISPSSRGVDSSRRSSFSDLQTSDEQSRQSKIAAARSPRRSSDSQHHQHHHQHQSTPRPPTFYAPPPLHNNNNNNTSSTATTSLILASPSPSRRRARSSLIRDAPSIADLYAATTEEVRTNFPSSSPAQHSRQRRFMSSQSRQMLSSNNLDSSIDHSASTKDLFNTNNSRRSSTLGDTDTTADDFIIPNKTANLKRHESLDTVDTLEDEIMIRKEEEEQVSNHSLSSFLGRDNANNDELYSSNASSNNNKDASSVFDASIVDSIALTKFKNKRGTSWASLSTPPCVFDSTAATETKEKSRRRSRSSKPPRSSSRRSSRSVGSSKSSSSRSVASTKSSSSRSVASTKSSSSRSVASSDKDESRRSRRSSSSEKKRSSSSKKSGTERSRSSSRRRSSSRKRDEASSSRRRSVERISN